MHFIEHDQCKNSPKNIFITNQFKQDLEQNGRFIKCEILTVITHGKDGAVRAITSDFNNEEIIVIAFYTFTWGKNPKVIEKKFYEWKDVLS